VVVDGEAAPAAAARGKSDSWDAAATYIAGPATQAKLVAAQPAEAEPEIAAEAELDLSPLDTDGDLVPPVAAAPAPRPVDDGVELFGEVDSSGMLAGPDLAEFDVSELDIRPPEAGDEDAARAEPEPATVLFDAPVAEEPPTRLLDAEPAPEVEPEPAPVPASPAAVHAGLILQRGGRLERVIQWDSDRLTLGRASECEIVLATPEVSRRHAMLVRDGERFEVRDLESINGTFVNGEKVSRRTLKVGDVVRVEDFELTFVLDSAPLGDAVKAEPTPVAEPSAGPDPNLTQIGEMMDLAPFVAGEAEEETATAMSFEPLAGDEIAEVPEVPMLEPEPETVLLSDEADEEKDLVESPREARVLRLELRIRMEELPPALRQALSAVDVSDLRLPVELRLATEDEG
jgi:pSer/pThr/pTyr-binding forkhead associated (FHA) protein